MNTPYVFKKCTKCGEWLVACKVNFTKHKCGKYGLRGYCKKCSNKSMKKWSEKNKPLTDEERRQLIRKILFKSTGINYE